MFLHPMKIISLVLALAAVFMVLPARAELPPLIPRQLLFGNPEKTSPALSPDGKRLAWLAPDTNNVLQVWVQTIGQEDAKIVTADKKRGIRQYLWAKDNRTLLYLQDSDGDENFHVYGVDLGSGNVRDYSPFQGVRAGLVDEVSVLFDPCVVGGNSPRSMFVTPDLNSPEGVTRLRLIHLEQVGENVVWLQYEVIH